MMKTTLLTLITILVLLGLSGNVVHAWEPLEECWGDPVIWSNDTTMAISPVSFPSGSVDRDDLMIAFDRWNDMRGMSFEFERIVDDNNTYGRGNGVNEVAFVDNAVVGGAWAIARVQPGTCFFAGQGIVEVDILFNADKPWEMGAHDPRTVTTEQNFRRAAVHEMGHALGLDHENDSMAVMLETAAAFHGGHEAFRAGPFPDDAVGARALYPHPNTATDFAISNFRWVASNTTDLILGTGVQRTCPGFDFVTDFGFSNLGKTWEQMGYVVVLSSDLDISTNDRIVGSGQVFGPPGTFFSEPFSVTVPIDMQEGDYFVGGILDPRNEITEEYEGNNRVAFPGTLRVLPRVNCLE